MLKWYFKEPGKNEDFAEYVIPRAIAGVISFCVLTMILCVIGQYV